MRTIKVAALVLVASLVVVDSSPATTDRTTGKQTTAKSDMPPESSPSSFLKKAAANGIAEVELGKLAEQRATSPAVRAFAQQMVADHGKANEKLRALAAQKQIELPTSLDEKHAGMRNDLAGKSGLEFDEAYMEDMTNGHEKVVEAFRNASISSTDDDVKQFAGSSLPMLEGHLQKARAIEASMPKASAE